MAERPLAWVRARELVIRRIRCGRGFAYRTADGARITDPAMLARIRALAIPPAYADVRIAADPSAHLQAIGRDEAGRLQYRYHPRWEAVRELRKARRLERIAGVLPVLRRTVRRDLDLPGLPRRKVLALAVALIDRAYIRVGGEDYARARGGRGAATLLKRDLVIADDGIALNFEGKGGKRVSHRVVDPGLAQLLSMVAGLPGRRLLQYRAEDGTHRPISASEINRYLRAAGGMPISAKDLRMLGGSALAARILVKVKPASKPYALKRQLADVMRSVSVRLGNTPAVTRKSYVHAIVVDAFSNGGLHRAYRTAEAARNLKRVEKMLHGLARRAMREARSAGLPPVLGGTRAVARPTK
jgi:DNA topoisomerase I